jgi:hypothetical protein
MAGPHFRSARSIFSLSHDHVSDDDTKLNSEAHLPGVVCMGHGFDGVTPDLGGFRRLRRGGDEAAGRARGCQPVAGRYLDEMNE